MAAARSQVTGAAFALAVLASCGNQSEGPPPRYAEAPPEERHPEATPPVAVPEAAVEPPDGGPGSSPDRSVDVAAGSADGGESPRGSGQDRRANVATGPTDGSALPPGPGQTGSAGDGASAVETAGMPEPVQVLSATGPLTPEQWAAMLALGRRKYAGICAGCHGTGIGPRLAGRRKTAAAVRRQVRRGAGDMRPIPPRRLSDDELEAVIVYLSTIRAVVDVRPPAAAPGT